MQMEVAVPQGVAAGQPLVVQTPGGPMQTVVPDGLKEGDKFMIMAPAAQQMDRDGDGDSAAAREIAAKMVGEWELLGTSCPCFCPLLWQMPSTYKGRFVIHPANAQMQYPLTGRQELWVFPFLGLPCSFLHWCPIADLKMIGEYDVSGTASTVSIRNTNKPEWDPMGKYSTFTRKLTSVDAKNQTATFSMTLSSPFGKGAGMVEVDGRAMTITETYTADRFIGTSSVRVVSRKVA